MKLVLFLVFFSAFAEEKILIDPRLEDSTPLKEEGLIGPDSRPKQGPNAQIPNDPFAYMRQRMEEMRRHFFDSDPFGNGHSFTGNSGIDITWKKNGDHLDLIISHQDPISVKVRPESVEISSNGSTKTKTKSGSFMSSSRFKQIIGLPFEVDPKKAQVKKDKTKTTVSFPMDQNSRRPIGPKGRPI